MRVKRFLAVLFLVSFVGFVAIGISVYQASKPTVTAAAASAVPPVVSSPATSAESKKEAARLFVLKFKRIMAAKGIQDALLSGGIDARVVCQDAETSSTLLVWGGEVNRPLAYNLMRQGSLKKLLRGAKLTQVIFLNVPTNEKPSEWDLARVGPGMNYSVN